MIWAIPIAPHGAAFPSVVIIHASMVVGFLCGREQSNRE